MTDLALRYWYVVLAVAVVVTMLFVCHAARLVEWCWWWRQDHDGSMRRELEK